MHKPKWAWNKGNEANDWFVSKRSAQARLLRSIKVASFVNDYRKGSTTRVHREFFNDVTGYFNSAGIRR